MSMEGNRVLYANGVAIAFIALICILLRIWGPRPRRPLMLADPSRQRHQAKEGLPPPPVYTYSAHRPFIRAKTTYLPVPSPAPPRQEPGVVPLILRKLRP